jgi:predicted nucleic acid-binding protein
MEGTLLGAADALHIGAARVARVDLFVTADLRQAQAAKALGLKTELIEV